MSITIVYLLLCLIPESDFHFSWAVMVLFWVGKFVFDVVVGMVVALVKDWWEMAKK